MDHPSQLVTFGLSSAEARAWVVHTSGNQKPRVVEMREERPSYWSTSTELSPGEYRCRYYSGDERSVHYQGPATVEAYTVMHDRDGQPEKAIAACLLADGRRAWGVADDAALGAEMCRDEWVGRAVELTADGTLFG